VRGQRVNIESNSMVNIDHVKKRRSERKVNTIRAKTRRRSAKDMRMIIMRRCKKPDFATVSFIECLGSHSRLITEKSHYGTCTKKSEIRTSCRENIIQRGRHITYYFIIL
jgi:hypothetical protein